MQFTYHEANTRGAAHHGWLNSQHTFSFANYYDPDRMGFGVLRVINDDVVAPSMGFGTHPHKNMEIISVPLKGSLKHKDTMGNDFVIRKGEVQAMSAGTGVAHSEYNNSHNEEVNFLQIWVMPKKNNIAPAYSQKEFSETERRNKLQLIVSPDGRDHSVKINQDAFFSLTEIESGVQLEYEKYLKGNGLYIFVLEGSLKVGDKVLNKRDGLGIESFEQISLNALKKTEVLLMEVPLLA